MSESLSGKREGLQDNATRKKGSLLLTRVRAPAASKFTADSSEGSCRIQCSGTGVREHRAQAVTQIYRVSTRRW